MAEDKNKNRHMDAHSGKQETHDDTNIAEEESQKNTGSRRPESSDGEYHQSAASDIKSGREKKSRLEESGKEKSRQQQTSDADAEDQDYEEIIAGLKEELEMSRERMLRKAAEFDNLKKRTQRERVLYFEDAKVDAVSKFLPIREDLKRSVDLSRERNVDAGFLEGLELVLNNFDRVLESIGVRPIEETGVPFDVDEHDAMLSQPASDKSTESNTVLQVLEPGYKIGDRVIRHAKVIVSQ